MGEAILLHVRRGDYLTTSGFKVLSQDYYRQARSLLEQLDPKLTSRPIYVVSDDPAAAIPLVRTAWPNAGLLDLSDPLDVLAMIAHAPVKVIANSTLSLWGALLGHPDSLVAYPERWHEDQEWGATLCRGRGWYQVPVR